MAKQLSVRIDDELEELMEKEKKRSPYEPTDSDIVRAALREYLKGNSKPTVMMQTAD